MAYAIPRSASDLSDAVHPQLSPHISQVTLYLGVRWGTLACEGWDARAGRAGRGTYEIGEPGRHITVEIDGFGAPCVHIVVNLSTTNVHPKASGFFRAGSSASDDPSRCWAQRRAAPLTTRPSTSCVSGKAGHGSLLWASAQ